MYSKLSDLAKRLDGRKRRIAVAAAEDNAIIETLKIVTGQGLADCILYGNKAEILKLIGGEWNSFEIADFSDPREAALEAALTVSRGHADILMKGLVNSSDFLRAVLDKEKGLAAGKVLSHLAVFEVLGYGRLQFHTDGGMNTYPDVELKKAIIDNGLAALNKIGIEKPNVAVLSANEVVNSKIPSTVDAQKLVDMNDNGEFTPCIMEGPISLDVALDKKAALHKKMNSRISGETDLFVVPNIDAGNMIGKTLIYCAKAKMAGVILGGRNPIVMTSRAESPEGKHHSIVMACALS
jgi:phosphate butyryltransferase